MTRQIYSICFRAETKKMGNIQPGFPSYAIQPSSGDIDLETPDPAPASTSDPYSGLAPSVASAAQQQLGLPTSTPPPAPTTPPKADGANNAPPEWRCYKPGELNPQLNSFSSLDVMGNSQLAGYSSNPMASIGEALGRAIRPDVTRGTKSSLIRAVVLGGYVAEGGEARSYNMNIEPQAAGALVNRVQVIYVRVPELTLLSDPFCNDNTFSTEQVEALVTMHPRASVPNWTTDQPELVPGTIVEVEFSENYSRGIVKGILDEATSTAFFGPGSGAKDAFGSGAGGHIAGIVPTHDPHKVWDKLFKQLKSGNHWIKSDGLSQKLKDIPTKLTAHINSKGRSDVKVTSNGMTRTIQDTLKGGAGRIKTSLHMLGLAHDLQIHSKDVSKYGYAGKVPNGSNGTLIKDHQLMRLMKSYATKNGLVWGGEFKKGNPESIPAGDGVAAFTCYTMELHHYELDRSEYASELPAKVLQALADTGFTVTDLKSSTKRQKVYARIASDVV